MKIKITKENAEKIEAALLGVNGKATAHTYTTFREIEIFAHESENYLSTKYLLKNSYSGAIGVSISGSKVANSYRSTRAGTKITIVRGAVHWFLVDIKSVTIFINGGGSDVVTLTTEQKEEAVTRFRDQL